MKTFFISDTHFNHKNILTYCKNTRKFKNIDEMNNNIITNWNKMVSYDDTVYHLGDFAFGDINKTRDIINRLNGNIHLILGNHDNHLDKETLNLFSSYQHYLEINIEGFDIILMHYPIAEFNGRHRGYFHLHGHCHGRYRTKERILDVGIDNRNDCCLWSWEEIRDKLSKIDHPHSRHSKK